MPMIKIILVAILIICIVCYYGLSKIRVKNDLEAFIDLEKTAIKAVTTTSNIIKIADDLEALGFKTSITSKGGVDRSDLQLKVRKKKKSA